MARSELQVNQFPSIIGGIRAHFRAEFVGLALFAIGAFALLSLRADAGVPWLVRAMGWTAPLFAVTMVVSGAVVMLRNRLGYWSIEAAVGAEMLLLAMAAGSFVVKNQPFDWGVRADGTNGGVLGWIMGGLLMDAVGFEPALAIVVAAAAVGSFLVIRYSPLIYGVAYSRRLLPVLVVYWRWLLAEYPIWRRASSRDNSGFVPAGGANFVTPYADQPELAVGGANGFSQAGKSLAAKSTTDVSKSSPNRSATASVGDSVKKTAAFVATKAKAAKPVKKAGSTVKPVYTLPPMDLLTPEVGLSGGADVKALEARIEQTLEDFDVPVRVVHVESGPTVTQFGVEPLYLERSSGRRKVRVNRIASLADDLALALAAKSVRIEAPVPGRPYVGIEVPNSVKTLVSLRGILDSPAVKKTDAQLLMGLGRDTSGEPVVMDLTKAPHLLIAGATGSGKSVCINSILMSLLMRHGPDTLQLVLVDPKMVELLGYNGIPHLIGKVITDVDQVMGALTWLLLQMDDRYQLFRENGVRNIAAYNELAHQKSRGKEKMDTLPYIVLVVDELADLMMTAAEDVERQVCRLAQMARATGIHLILATQRPSTDVVTGVIKANFPSRIAFAVTSQVDSRVILDTQGAERLLGYGDMLLLRPDAAKLHRIQGCYVSDDEIDDVVSFWRMNSDEGARTVPPWNGLMDRMDHDDELILDAIDLLRGMQTCSTSMLQRKMRLGYPKAARLMEQLEQKGVVGPDMGGGQGRAVLLKAGEAEDEDELEDFF